MRRIILNDMRALNEAEFSRAHLDFTTSNYQESLELLQQAQGAQLETAQQMQVAETPETPAESGEASD